MPDYEFTIEDDSMTTTFGAIRDQLTSLIEAATPNASPGDVQYRYVPEREYMLIEWADDNAGSAALRTFDIRRVGNSTNLSLNAPDEMMRTEQLMITIAYPRMAGLYGETLDDMEDAIRTDAAQIYDIALDPANRIDGWHGSMDISIEEPIRDGEMWFQMIVVTVVYCESMTLALS